MLAVYKFTRLRVFLHTFGSIHCLIPPSFLSKPRLRLAREAGVRGDLMVSHPLLDLSKLISLSF